MPGDDVKYQDSCVYLYFQVNISKDAWDISVWNLAPSPVPGVVHPVRAEARSPGPWVINAKWNVKIIHEM